MEGKQFRSRFTGFKRLSSKLSGQTNQHTQHRRRDTTNGRADGLELIRKRIKHVFTTQNCTEWYLRGTRLAAAVVAVVAQ